MSLKSARKHRLEMRHQLVFWLLCGILAAVSCWSLDLLLRFRLLRQEFLADLEWSEDISRARAGLANWRADQPGSAEAIIPLLEDAERAASGMLAREQGKNPRWSGARQDLTLALESLRLSSGQGAAASDPSSNPGLSREDALWSAAASAGVALEVLADAAAQRFVQTAEAWGSYGTTLASLVTAVLALAALSLVLLHLAHRRRLALAAAHNEVVLRASHDPLTGLWNRGAILRLLGSELARAQRLGVPLGVVLADIDQFSKINDRFGQEQGDFILEQLAVRLRSLVRPYDTLGRFGGDSFLLVLPSCDAAGTQAVAERLGEAVDRQEFEHAHGHVRLSLSLAYLICTPPSHLDIERLIRCLQQGIQTSRHQGLGQITPVAADSTPPEQPFSSFPQRSL